MGAPSAQATPSVEVRDLCKSFGEHEVLSQVSVGVAPGEFLGLLGPSGGGKTTLLRSIAGFVAPSSGEIRVDGRDVTFVAPHRRRIGVVFQNYALFPHMTVAQNIGYGLRVARRKRAAAAARVQELLALVGLQEHADKAPRQLSGGQQQRVALARALAINPTVLLLDEPLSALDPSLRRNVGRELKAIQRSAHTSTIMVTHDRDEAFTLADRIAVIDAGRIVQDDVPAQLYRCPASRFVAELLGPCNLLAGRVLEHSGERMTVRCGGVVLAARCSVPRDGEVEVLVRPEDVALGDAPAPAGADNELRMSVTEVAYFGDRADVRLEGAGLALSATVHAREVAAVVPGADVRVRFGRDATYVL